MIRRLQDRKKEIAIVTRIALSVVAPLTTSVVGMYDLTDNLAQALLIMMRSDLTSKKSRLSPRPHVAGGETARSDAEHGQIWFAITDGDCLGILC